MPDWYRDHNLSPECYPDEVYLDWAQDNGLHVDAAGNVTDPAELVADEADDAEAWRRDDGQPNGLDTWDF